MFSRSVTPRFGWAFEAHTAMEQATAAMLPAGSLKRFMQTHMGAINEFSIRQDKDPDKKGPPHFLDIEILTDGAVDNGQQPSAEQAHAHFTDDYKHRQNDMLRDGFLARQSLETFPNTYRRISRLYGQLVRTLRSLRTRPPGNDQHRAMLQNHLIKTLGAMAHYVGDLHQPMHNSLYYTWPLAHGGKKFPDVHLFLEVESQPASYADWQQGVQSRAWLPLPRRSLPDIQATLLEEIRKAYLRIFDIAQADRMARAWYPDQPQRYQDVLLRAWSPIAASQMEQATRNLAMILHSAYEEAGRPSVDLII